jgi:hypothetical protein
MAAWVSGESIGNSPRFSGGSGRNIGKTADGGKNGERAAERAAEPLWMREPISYFGFRRININFNF